MNYPGGPTYPLGALELNTPSSEDLSLRILPLAAGGVAGFALGWWAGRHVLLAAAVRDLNRMTRGGRALIVSRRR